jgi:HAD superfamily hydrolase (TIGR01509 family)
MIKTIAFDLGGVIATISQREAVSRFREIGLADAEVRLDPYTQSGIFGDLEAGAITSETFREKLSELCGKNISFDECVYAWKGYFADLPQRNLDELDRLRCKGYRVILASNTNPFIMSWARTEHFTTDGKCLDDYLDALYLSFQLKLMKPSPEFFTRILTEENCKPEETLFVDDGERNVDAASRLGMETLHPENGRDWTGDLEKKLSLLSDK